MLKGGNMGQRNGLSKLEIIITIIVLLFIAAIFWPAQGKEKRIILRMRCSNNLKDIGSSFGLYLNDYEGMFPQLPGSGPWSKQLGFPFDLSKPEFKEGGAQSNVSRTITASWYLLVREADVSPKSFVCEATREIDAYNGKNSRGAELTKLWDFSADPYKHVSYAMHNPYGDYPASERRPVNFAVAADMSPWFHLGDIVKPDSSNQDYRKNISLLPPYYSGANVTRESIKQANAFAHGREGQNILYIDGHSEYLKTTDNSFKHDNIYTFWSTPQNPTESDIRIGANPTSRSKENDAQSPDDSFLAI
jgi:hypothetical protein